MLAMRRSSGRGMGRENVMDSLEDNPFFDDGCIHCYNFYNGFTVFKPEELKQSLLPTLEKLFRQDPESLPFKQPVDPQVSLSSL